MKRKIIKFEKRFMRLLSVLLFIGLLALNTTLTAKGITPFYAVVVKTQQLSNFSEDPELQELQLQITRLASTIRFQYDSTVLPSASIQILDQIVHIIKEYGDSYQYIIQVHSFEEGQTNIYALQYSIRRANAIHTYLKNHGIASQQILPQGMGSSDRKCFDVEEENCYSQNNRMELIVRKNNLEDKKIELSSELMLLASKLYYDTYGALLYENNEIIKEMADYIKQSNDNYKLIVHAYDPVTPEYFNVAMCETKGESLKYSLLINGVATERIQVIPKGNEQYQWTGKYVQFLLEIQKL